MMVHWLYLFQEHHLCLQVLLINLEEVVEQVLLLQDSLEELVEVFGLLILVFPLLME